MTGPRLDHDANWVEVDLLAEPRAWAAATVASRWATQQAGADRDRIQAGTSSIARIVGSLDATALDAALLLYPVADEPVVIVVGLRSFAAAPELTLERLGDELCVPEQLLETPRDRSVVETPAGPAVRLVQRYHEPFSTGVVEVRDHVSYGWLVSGSGAETIVVTVSTVFVDLVAAGSWIIAVDELARSLTGCGRRPSTTRAGWAGHGT